ncbi:MAG: hypothetical protein M1289_02780 [Patescibacteria group bacterium]|nr:hypothetical protein [Patescibacteria group bacterium]
MDSNQNEQNGQAVKPQAPLSAVSSSTAGKEQEGVPVDAGELIRPSEPELSISDEEKEAGAEGVSQYPKLSEEHAKIGIRHAGEGVPASAVPSGMVQLPMDSQKATGILRMHKKVSESIVWLAELVLRQIKINRKK